MMKRIRPVHMPSTYLPWHKGFAACGVSLSRVDHDTAIHRATCPDCRRIEGRRAIMESLA